MFSLCDFFTFFFISPRKMSLQRGMAVGSGRSLASQPPSLVSRFLAQIMFIIDVSIHSVARVNEFNKRSKLKGTLLCFLQKKKGTQNNVKTMPMNNISR